MNLFAHIGIIYNEGEMCTNNKLYISYKLFST